MIYIFDHLPTIKQIYFHCLNLYDMLVFRRKYPFDGSDDEVIMANVGTPVGIAIDIESDHLYWLDYSMGILSRSDLDGSNTTEILTDLNNPHAIALDTVNK